MKFLHLRSSVAGKLPEAGDIDVGQIAINFNDADPFLSVKDSAGNVQRLNSATVSGTAPTTPADGALWVDTSTDPPKLMVWDATNTTWVEIGGDAGQWNRDATGYLYPKTITDQVGTGGTATDPDAAITADGGLFLRRTDGTDDPKITMATDNSRAGFIAFTSDGPNAQRSAQWEFKNTTANPGGDSGIVIIKPHGGIDLTATGADDACINVSPYISQDWGTADADKIRVQNYSENVFAAGSMGAVTARKSFTAGNINVSGANIPGHFKAIGNSAQTGLATDTAFEAEFDTTQVFSINHSGSGYFAGKVGVGTASPAKELEVSGTIRATVFDIDNLPALP